MHCAIRVHVHPLFLLFRCCYNAACVMILTRFRFRISPALCRHYRSPHLARSFTYVVPDSVEAVADESDIVCSCVRTIEGGGAVVSLTHLLHLITPARG